MLSSSTAASLLANQFNPAQPLLVKKLSEFAQLPTKGSPLSAGYDLYAAKEMIIKSMDKAIIPTDISIALPIGTYGRVAPRSGLAVKHFLDVGAGVVDCDYRGSLGVVLFNFSQKDYKVSLGDRIAQLVVERIASPEVVETDDLDATVRGDGGFGSTGTN